MRLNLSMKALAMCSLLAASSAFAFDLELALQPGVSVASKLKDGEPFQLTTEGLRRSIQMGGCSFEIKLTPRGERFMGSLGAYGDGAIAWQAGSSGPKCPKCPKYERATVREEQIHFASDAAAERWLSRYVQSIGAARVSPGVYVSAYNWRGGTQLNIEVWSLCSAEGAHIDVKNIATPDAATKSSAGGVSAPCKPVSQDVVNDANTSWEKHWRMLDMVHAAQKPAH